MILKKFFHTVLNDPKKLALVTEKKEIDYLELYKKFSAYVIFFKKNINKNKKLIILLEDAEHILVSFLACLFLRITIFPINYETNLKDIEKISHEIKTSYILTDKKIKKTRSFNCIDVKKIKSKNNKNFIDISNQKLLNEKEFNFIVALSSGTSGKSKKIILTNLCKFKRAAHTIKYYRLGNNVSTIICSPLFHSLAQRLFFIAIISGEKIVILKKFSPEKWYYYIKKYKIKFSMLVSTHIRLILKSKKNFKKLSTLKSLISSSDSISKNDKKTLLRKLNCDLHEIYGTSETATLTNLNLRKDKNYLDSVGKVLDDTKINIIDKKNKIGEIHGKNKRMFKGYFGKKNLNGYFNTGDLGEVDKDGYLYYRGRFKDIIKISGMNIHPVEIEHKIKKCSSVIECAVIGEKNEHFGELIKAIIVAKNQKTLTQIQIKKYLRNNLNEYEIPQIIEFVDELPKNKLGKIDKKKLKNINFKNNININDNVTKYLNLINKIK